MSGFTRATVVAIEVVLVLVIGTRWVVAESAGAPSTLGESTVGRLTGTESAASPPTTAESTGLPPATTEPTVAEPPAAEPPVAEPEAVRVLLAGDSILRQTGPALDESFGPEVAITNEAVNGSGLLTPGVLDWVAHLRTLVAEQDPDVVVLLWVGNYTDTDFWIGEDGQVVPHNTLAFYAAWSEQADRIMQDLETSDADVYLVLPPPEFTELNREITVNLRQVYTQLAARWPRLHVIDANAALAGASGEYLESMTTDSGEVVPLRATDTVHLTEAGAARLAQTIHQGIEPSL